MVVTTSTCSFYQNNNTIIAKPLHFFYPHGDLVLKNKRVLPSTQYDTFFYILYETATTNLKATRIQSKLNKMTPFIYLLLDIDECSSSPCENGGICHDQINAFNCSCVLGFNGTTCQNSEYWASNLANILFTHVCKRK